MCPQKIPVTVRGEATQAAVQCIQISTDYVLAPGAGMACLSSTVLACTLYTVQYTAQAAAEEEEYSFLCNQYPLPGYTGHTQPHREQGEQ